MNFENLNKMISYIERHLTEEISYKELARIVGVSEYNLQRIFMFLTGVSVSEYIRKRRLSKAYEELKKTDIKIVDLALKYGYDSSVSFSRAFKQYFQMTPTECRRNDKSFKLFSVLTFRKDLFSHQEISYQICELEEKKLYCLGVSASTHEDMLFKIRELYRAIRDGEAQLQGISSDFGGLYGISDCSKGDYNYYVGTEVCQQDKARITIEGGRYAVFEAGSEEQKDIVNVYRYVYDQWLKSTDYELDDKPEMEYYENQNCYIYFKIKEKQN